MKFELPEDHSMREMRRLMEQHDRQFGSQSAKDIIEAAKSPAERLGISESELEQVQQAIQQRDEIERLQRGGLSETAWEQVQREVKLRDEVERLQRGGLLQGAQDQVQEQVRLQEEAEKAAELMSVGAFADTRELQTVIQDMPRVSDAFGRLLMEDRSMDFTPPPINTGANLLREQIDIAREQLDTAKQGRLDAERREQEAKEEARVARRNTRIMLYFSFASLIAAVLAIVYDKVDWINW